MIGFVPSFLRIKSQQVDQSSGKKSPLQIDDMKSSRLPTLQEEETTDVKSSDLFPLVREEADGKDDAAEVNKHYTVVHKYSHMLLEKRH